MVRVDARKARGYSGQRKHDLRIGPQPAYVDRAAFEGEKETALKDIELTKLASQAGARKERAVIANHARTVTAQLDADRAEYLAAAQAEIAEIAQESKELAGAAADLERRESDLAEKVGFLKTAFNLLQRAVVVNCH